MMMSCVTKRVEDEPLDVLGVPLAFAGQGLSHLGQCIDGADAHYPAKGTVMLIALLPRSAPVSIYNSVHFLSDDRVYCGNHHGPNYREDLPGPYFTTALRAPTCCCRSASLLAS